MIVYLDYLLEPTEVKYEIISGRLFYLTQSGGKGMTIEYLDTLAFLLSLARQLLMTCLMPELMWMMMIKLFN